MRPCIFIDPKKAIDLPTSITDYTLCLQKESRGSASVVDSFSRTLTQKQQILLEYRSESILFHLNDGSMQRQSTEVLLKSREDIAMGPIKQALTDEKCKRLLLPIWQGEVKLQEFALLDDQEKSVARLLTFAFANQGTLLCLQPMRGYRDAYQALQEALPAKASCSISTFFALAPAYLKKPPIKLKKNAPLWQSCNQIGTTFLEVAKANEAGIIADYDIEFLHDYRVALRKIRSLLSLCPKSYAVNTTFELKTYLAELMHQSNTLRDLDVYLHQQEKYSAMVPTKLQPGLEILFTYFKERRKESHEQFSQTLTSSEYLKKRKKIAKDFAKGEFKKGKKALVPTLCFAQKIISKRYHKICTIAASITPTTEDETVHELRIHCKKLRYIMLFFAPLFDEEKINTILKSLKKAQTSLGKFNDYSVQQEKLSQFLAEFSEPKHEKAVAESVGALTALLYQRQQQERAQVMEHFRQFESDTIEKLMAELFFRPRKSQ